MFCLISQVLGAGLWIQHVQGHESLANQDVCFVAYCGVVCPSTSWSSGSVYVGAVLLGGLGTESFSYGAVATGLHVLLECNASWVRSLQGVGIADGDHGVSDEWNEQKAQSLCARFLSGRCSDVVTCRRQPATSLLQIPWECWNRYLTACDIE